MALHLWKWVQWDSCRTTFSLVTITLFCVVACSSSYPLHETIASGNAGGAVELIEHGEDVNAYNKAGYTPLQLAVSYQQDSVIDALIAAGADLNARTIDGRSPLVMAAHSSQIDVMKLLLQNGAKVAELKSGQSPVFEVIENGDLELVKLLLSAGADVDYAYYSGATALFFSAYLGKFDIAEYLIKNNANINAATEDRRTSLHAAAYRNHADIAELLLMNGAIVTASSDSDEATYATAKLFRFMGERHGKAGDRKEALSYLSQSAAYFDLATLAFEARVSELSMAVFKRRMWSVASIVFAAFAASNQASYNNVITPSGQIVGVGSANFSIADTSDLRELKKAYKAMMDECRAEGMQVAEILTCSHDGKMPVQNCIN